MKAWIRSLSLAVVALGFVAGAGRTADAHPHVWIESRSDLVLDDEGRITAINVEWRFDEMYSLAAVEGLDANGDGIYEAEETQSLAKENIEALKEYDYFVYAQANGQKVPYGEVTEYGNLFANGVLTLYFRVPLATPVDPTNTNFTYSIYDPSFYIAIELPKQDPIQVLGTLASPCHIKISKSAAEAENYQYSEDFWDQEANKGMGAMFAQPISVDCTATAKKAADSTQH
ncbi:DUF1007 family protein [Rhodoligotrophos defluvii]|uniref:DUF1007 family protein n=1 Tax=Rhodoligotrophos defluvii TaxID=2561934 RepID=UPI0010C994CD|nr:DUF1007 family protein [Rhodoligotrophos defluvii]